MLKKSMVIAAAVAALAAFALPATAGANWKHKDLGNLQKSVQFGLTGQIVFETENGGVKCQITSLAQFTPGTTGDIETFAPDAESGGTATTRCQGLKLESQCQFHTIQPTGLPWTIHTAAANTITITTGQIHSTATGAFCIGKAITIDPGTVTATTNAGPVTTATLSGTLTTTIETVDEDAKITGQLTVEGDAHGTYEV